MTGVRRLALVSLTARYDVIARLRQLENAVADLAARLPAIRRELAAIRELLEDDE